jgi:hypothetical protein
MIFDSLFNSAYGVLLYLILIVAISIYILNIMNPSIEKIQSLHNYI